MQGCMFRTTRVIYRLVLAHEYERNALCKFTEYAVGCIDVMPYPGVSEGGLDSLFSKIHAIMLPTDLHCQQLGTFVDGVSANDEWMNEHFRRLPSISHEWPNPSPTLAHISSDNLNNLFSKTFRLVSSCGKNRTELSLISLLDTL